jgi:hypothetical protein
MPPALPPPPPSQQAQHAHRSTWMCAAVGGFCGEPLASAAFSPDGSVLAVAGGGGVITIWDAQQTEMLGVLPPLPPPQGQQQGGVGTGCAAPAVRQMVFLTDSPHLVSSGTSQSKALA